MEGSKALLSRFNHMTQIDNRVRQIVRRNANDIAVKTKANAPVDTGRLRSSVNVNVSGSTQHTKAIISANAYNRGFNYGLYQERYNRRGKSDFMGRAFRATVPRFRQEMAEAMRRR